ncbi:MAG: uncharacterized protein QOH46_3293, partial [Solirubrobacteraceae bacterium]|nr:uncharacterized protein [Solirubrobacteraceae bacterium]
MIAAIVIGFAAGMVAGLLGVGGGILFVPALVLALNLSQVDAEATALLAIVPVSALGAWRQHRYGNVRPRDGALLGVGGGILFVPALVLALDLSQVDAEATSLLAIVPVAALGAWRQHRYGNVRPRDGALLGV